jgi:hypothetical protein
VAALAVHIMINETLTGATYDIDGGQQLVPAKATQCCHQLPDRSAPLRSGGTNSMPYRGPASSIRCISL